MSAFFAKFNIIVVMGNHLPYARSIARTIHHTFKPNAVIYTGNFPPPIDALRKLKIPVIMCRSKYPLNSTYLDDVRENDGLVVWTYKSRFHNARDMFIGSN